MDDIFDDEYWAAVDGKKPDVSTQIRNAEALALANPTTGIWCFQCHSYCCTHV